MRFFLHYQCSRPPELIELSFLFQSWSDRSSWTSWTKEHTGECLEIYPNKRYIYFDWTTNANELSQWWYHFCRNLYESKTTWFEFFFWLKIISIKTFEFYNFHWNRCLISFYSISFIFRWNTMSQGTWSSMARSIILKK